MIKNEGSALCAARKVVACALCGPSGTMTSRRPGGTEPVVDETSREATASQERGGELCTCGHRASSHVALKYSCQAPGEDKGFCPCMRFLSGKLFQGVSPRFRRGRPKSKKVG